MRRVPALDGPALRLVADTMPSSASASRTGSGSGERGARVRALEGFSTRLDCPNVDTTHLTRSAPADRVVVASPVEIDAEARAFVVAGRVIAGSFYRPRHPGPLPEEIVELVERAAARWSPAPVFVLDVARSDRRNWLLETNCFHASRLYDSDVVAIVQHVSAYVAMNG